MSVLSKLRTHPFWQYYKQVLRPLTFRMLSTLHSPIPFSQRLSGFLPKLVNRDFLKETAPQRHLDPAFNIRTLELVRSALPFRKIESLEIERLGCAMTNEVYVCSLPSNEKLLLRLYGHGTELFFERHRELATFRKLSEKGYGPKLLASFETGRIEEFIDSTNLSANLIREPAISREVAYHLHKLHSLFPEAKQEDCELWFCMEKWYQKAEEAVEILRKEDRIHELGGLSLSSILRDILELKEFLTTKAHSPIVFCHNDAQYGNILKRNSNGELVLIDYEYSGYNYRGFDIGNHFCEWAADYDSKEPHKLNFSRYPTKEEQLVFLRSYLYHHFKSLNVHVSDLDFKYELESLYIECNQFGLASHLKWCLWGIIQAAHSQINFDFIEYSRQRLVEYRRVKDFFFSLSC